jgi:hypothetical protein
MSVDFEPPVRMATHFAAHSFPWFVAGGWAVDLFLDRRTRPHEDLEVAVFRKDQRSLREVFASWTWTKAVPGSRMRSAWSDQEWLELPVHELYAHGAGEEQVEVLLQESDDHRWRFRRELSVSMPLSEVGVRSRGIPILRPEIVLLYKAKAPREKDEQDFVALLPALDAAQATWLIEALERCHPGHPWRQRLDLRR